MTEKQTLVEKAKNQKFPGRTKTIISDEHIELALSWLRGEITNKQVCFALGLKYRGSNHYTHTARSLKEGYKKKHFSIDREGVRQR